MALQMCPRQRGAGSHSAVRGSWPCLARVLLAVVEWLRCLVKGSCSGSRSPLMAPRARTKALVLGVRDVGFSLHTLVCEPAHREVGLCLAAQGLSCAAGGPGFSLPRDLPGNFWLLHLLLLPRALSDTLTLYQAPATLRLASPAYCWQSLVQGQGWVLWKQDQSSDPVECRWRVLGARLCGPRGTDLARMCDCTGGTDLTCPPQSSRLQGNGGDRVPFKLCVCTRVRVPARAGLPVWQRT